MGYRLFQWFCAVGWPLSRLGVKLGLCDDGPREHPANALLGLAVLALALPFVFILACWFFSHLTIGWA